MSQLPEQAITQSRYAALHFVEGVAEKYDDDYYQASTYDSAVWAWQRPMLRRLLTSIRERSGRLKYLDFACGTGRIISEVEELTTDSLGVDIAPLMLARAAIRTRSPLRCGDILTQPAIADRDYDAITAFRIVLGAEPAIRLALLQDLAQRLRDEHSRLIFNVHFSRRSVLALTSGYRRLRGWPPLLMLSPNEVQRLVAASGLVIESVNGFGVLPRRLYRTPLGTHVRAVDGLASRSRAMTWLSQDLVFVCRRAAGRAGT
jgi:SAM-dependent methyltransferase